MKNKLLFTTLVSLMLHVSAIGQNIWAQKTDFTGTPRQLAVGFSIGNKGYIGTGGDQSGMGPCYNDFWQYNQITNSWVQKASIPYDSLIAAVGFSIGNKGYIGLGTYYTTTGNYFSDKFFEYDTTLNSWTQKANFPGILGDAPHAFSIGNKGYVVGASNELWEYSQINDSWVKKSDFSGEQRIFGVAFSIDTKGYFGTGLGAVSGVALNDLWEYNPSLDLWAQKTNMPDSARLGAFGFPIGTKGYIGGGYDNTSNGLFTHFWEYNPSTDTWIQKLNGPATFYPVSFSIGNKGYTGTGLADVGAFTKFWEYTQCDSIIGINFTHVDSALTVSFFDTISGSTSWFWDFGDGNTSTMQNPTHTYSTQGTYTVCLSISNICNSDTICASVSVTFTNINNYTGLIFPLKTFPNPFNSSTTLQTRKNLKEATLTIYNSFGQQVKEIKNISGQTVTLFRDNLPSGLYFVRLTEDNKVNTDGKLVITD